MRDWKDAGLDNKVRLNCLLVSFVHPVVGRKHDNQMFANFENYLSSLWIRTKETWSDLSAVTHSEFKAHERMRMAKTSRTNQTQKVKHEHWLQQFDGRIQQDHFES